jgi:lysozyme
MLNIIAACAVMGLVPCADSAFDTIDRRSTSVQARCVSALAEFEGFSATPYVDTRGNLTIGYGHKLDAKYISHAPVDREQAYRMLWSDVEHAESGARRVYPYFNVLPEKAQEALIHMAFQLGTNGLSKFVNLKKTIDNKRWADAGSECLHSHWQKQTPKRAQFCAKLFGSIK